MLMWMCDRCDSTFGIAPTPEAVPALPVQVVGAEGFRFADQAVAAVSLSVRAERMTMNAFRQTHLGAIREARDELKATVSFD